MIAVNSTSLIPAAGYTRVSGQGQIAGFGPVRQREDIQRFADKNGFEIVAWFDEAFTGTEEERPVFVEMLGTAMENGPKVVIVECLDRLARDLMVQSQILAKLCAEKITLYAANTGENVTVAMQDDPMRKAMIQMQGVFAELDKSLTVRKLRRGRQAKKAASGRCEGQKPYGTKPGEDVVLRRIGELAKKVGDVDQRYAKITERLNAEGFLTRRGKPFTSPRVREIIQKTLPAFAACARRLS